ncbi:hypothetical protein Noda2021_08270 [Candidatus Dependentiae bacterium Noda2021]|nr:hypothetical protein Noda2021_08270 [Candidatus Dependentiae bacterium Noda2021]
MPFHLRLLALGLIVIFSFGKAQESLTREIPFFSVHSNDLQERLADLDAALKNPIFISDVTFDCDVMCSEKELRYLFGIQSHHSVTAEDLKKGLLYLSQKNKFESLVVYLINEDTSPRLHVVLKSWWTFNKARCKGILLGKDKVLREYMLQPGERFDAIRHQHSVENIKTLFKSQGFLRFRSPVNLYEILQQKLSK